MPSIPPSHQQQQQPGGPWNGLHFAARGGFIERTLTLLSSKSIDIDQGTPEGVTPLMFAAIKGRTRIVRILLDRGANVSIAAREGDYTALHFSAGGGHLDATKLLVKAGSRLDAVCSLLADRCEGCTPLHLAASGGHLEVMSVLIEAGANPNSRRLDGATPLYMAARDGNIGVVKVLLRAGANPLLLATAFGPITIALDAAAGFGHSEMVRELIQQFGIGGCGGASGGTDALLMAAQEPHFEIAGILTAAGVIDTGEVLRDAVTKGNEKIVKLLLQQREEESRVVGSASYANTKNTYGRTALMVAIGFPRIARLLVDAGADTTSAIRLTDAEGRVVFNGTLLAFTDVHLREKKIKGKDATKDQLHSLHATRRLLLRVEAA